jgi:uncharacterized membrane protein
MNRLDWLAQMLLAGIFLYAGLSKILAFRRQPTGHAGPSLRCVELPRAGAFAIGLLEIAGALGLLVPVRYWQPDVLPLLAAAGLALLMAVAFVYHVRRKEPTDPIVGLFLLALFVIVGRL